MTVSEYVVKYELRDNLPKCRYCNNVPVFLGTKGFDLTWSFRNNCSNAECVSKAKGEPARNRTPEKQKAMTAKRKETYKNNPELWKQVNENIRLANLRVDEDGLTGYEKTAIGRKKNSFRKTWKGRLC